MKILILISLLFLSGCSVTHYSSKGWDAQGNMLWDIKLSHSTAMNNTEKSGLHGTLPDGAIFGLDKSITKDSPKSIKAVGEAVSKVVGGVAGAIIKGGIK